MTKLIRTLIRTETPSPAYVRTESTEIDGTPDIHHTTTVTGDHGTDRAVCTCGWTSTTFFWMDADDDSAANEAWAAAAEHERANPETCDGIDCDVC